MLQKTFFYIFKWNFLNYLVLHVSCSVEKKPFYHSIFTELWISGEVFWPTQYSSYESLLSNQFNFSRIPIYYRTQISKRFSKSIRKWKWSIAIYLHFLLCIKMISHCVITYIFLKRIILRFIILHLKQSSWFTLNKT